MRGNLILLRLVDVVYIQVVTGLPPQLSGDDAGKKATNYILGCCLGQQDNE